MQVLNIMQVVKQMNDRRNKINVLFSKSDSANVLMDNGIFRFKYTTRGKVSMKLLFSYRDGPEKRTETRQR